MTDGHAIIERTTTEEVGDIIIRDKILHILSIYPKLSPSMLQVGIGTSLPPKIWHPTLDKLVHDNIVTRSQVRAKTPGDRDQIYTVISLTI